MQIASALLALAALDHFVALVREDLLFHDRVVDFILGTALTATAFGLLKRKPFAWILGFALPVIVTSAFLVEFPSLDAGFAHPTMYSFAVLASLGVLSVWLVLWYRQRSYFYPDAQKA